MTRLLASLAYLGQLTTATAITAFFTLAPIIPATAIARTIPGKEIIISDILIITASIHPPKYPANVPSKVPIAKISTTSINVAGSELLEA